MATTVTWGVLGTAKIASQKVIPAIQAASNCTVTAIASRRPTRARTIAKELAISKVYDCYEALLDDPEIDVVYIPLPNHLHVPWSIKALEAGKHVLCEKPIGVGVEEAEQLLAVSQKYPDLKVMEAFMYRYHPQWEAARKQVHEGEIGELRTIESFFSYYNTNPDDIRNQAGTGGGALMDIGCYPISLSRFIFDREPDRVMGCMYTDPDFKVDRLTSALLDFGSGTSTFTCATQASPHQRVNIVGTAGRLEIEIPFNAPSNRACRIWHHGDAGTREICFPVCDQFTLQAERFAQAVLDKAAAPTPLEDAVANMKVIDALVSGASTSDC